MITKYLTCAFQSLLSQNKSIDQIRVILTSEGYFPADVSEVISQYQAGNLRSPDAPSSPAFPSPVLAQPPPPPLRFVIKLLSFLAFAASFALFVRIINVAFIFYTLFKGISDANGLVDIFESFPLFTFMPVYYGFIGSLFGYLGFKLLHPAPSSRNTALILLFITAVTLPFYKYTATLPFSHASSSTSPLALSLFNSDSLFLLILFITLIIAWRHFNYSDPSLTGNQTLVVIFFIILFFGSSGYISYTAFRAKSLSDSDLSLLEPQFHHHIYQPSFLPDHLTRTSKYFFSSKPYINGVVTLRALLSLPSSITLLNTSAPTETIIFDQTTAPADFDLQTFLASSKLAGAPEVVKMDSPDFTQAVYVGPVTDTQPRSHYLFLTNTDGMLFILTTLSPDITKGDLMNIAAGLK
ncbi:MAG TPA: hypothetical protein VF828_02040 [Patescibacteria group bacterium]